MASKLCLGWVGLIVIFLVFDSGLSVRAGLLFFFGTIFLVTLIAESFDHDPISRAVFQSFGALNIFIMFGLAGVLLTAVFTLDLLVWIQTGKTSQILASIKGEPTPLKHLVHLVMLGAAACMFTALPAVAVDQAYKGNSKAARFVQKQTSLGRHRIVRQISYRVMQLGGYLFISGFGLFFLGSDPNFPPVFVLAIGTVLVLLSIVTSLIWLRIYVGLWFPLLGLVARLGR